MPTPPASVDARIRELIRVLYEAHDQGGDPHLELWPDDHHHMALLDFTHARFSALPLQERGRQLLARAELIRLLGDELERAQLDLLNQARPHSPQEQSPVRLKELAQAMGLRTKGAVSHRHNRLIARSHDLPRTPQNGRRALAEQAERARERDLAATKDQVHHPHVLAAARALHEATHDLSLPDGDGESWLRDLGQLVQEEPLGHEQKTSLASMLRLAVAEIEHEPDLPPSVLEALEEARQATNYRN